MFRVMSSLSLVLVSATCAFAQGNSFFYQGRLESAGVPVTGNIDARFSLWDSAALGLQVGAAHTLLNIPASDGLFTVLVNSANQFGASAFNGQPRWLNIEVRSPAGGGAFVPLASRQQLASTPYAAFASAPWITSGTAISYTLGNVGIGTTTPTNRLQVAGDALIDTSVGSLRLIHTVTSTGWNFATTGGGATLLLREEPGNSSRVSVTTGGNVGIGTTAPSERLDVRGNLAVVGNGAFTGTLGVTGVGTFGNALNVTGNINAGSDIIFEPGNGIFANNGELVLGGANVIIALGDSTADIVNVPGDMNFTAAGASITFPAVAAGAPPMIQMFASGAANADRMVIAHSPGFTNWGLEYSDSQDRFNFLGGGTTHATIDLALGRVGIGVAAPGYKLHVDGGTDSEPGSGGFVVIGATAGANISMDNNEIMARNNGVASTLFLNNDGGDVVIAPGATTRVSVIEITGADLAERFPATGRIEPGMVVSIDPQNPGHLCKSTRAYDRCVAGVVSGAGDLPVGAILGNVPQSKDGPPIALSGRVWVRCDAAAHAIEPGDLLTSSDNAGHAMRAEPERSAGATLGKAMTRLEKGQTGLVLALVSLQ